MPAPAAYSQDGLPQRTRSRRYARGSRARFPRDRRAARARQGGPVVEPVVERAARHARAAPAGGAGRPGLMVRAGSACRGKPGVRLEARPARARGSRASWARGWARPHIRLICLRAAARSSEPSCAGARRCSTSTGTSADKRARQHRAGTSGPRPWDPWAPRTALKAERRDTAPDSFAQPKANRIEPVHLGRRREAARTSRRTQLAARTCRTTTSAATPAAPQQGPDTMRTCARPPLRGATASTRHRTDVAGRASEHPSIGPGGGSQPKSLPDAAPSCSAVAILTGRKAPRML